MNSLSTRARWVLTERGKGGTVRFALGARGLMKEGKYNLGISLAAYVKKWYCSLTEDH